jgi:hypothetical protein
MKRDDSVHTSSKVDDERVENVSEDAIQTTELNGHDQAADFLARTSKPIAVGPEDNARILRKIDWAILPILLAVYALQSLDKTSLSYAAVFGLVNDTHLVGTQYSWLGSIVYLAQLIMQPAVAFCLVKFPIGKFTAVMVFCWGCTLCGMAGATGFTGLMITRALLGAFEASVGTRFNIYVLTNIF